MNKVEVWRFGVVMYTGYITDCNKDKGHIVIDDSDDSGYTRLTIKLLS